MTTTPYIAERPPSVEEYLSLRHAVGWAELDRQAVEFGLRNALYSVCAMHGDVIAGCGRVVGDGAIYFYLQDVIVLPAYRGRGLGRRITEALMTFVSHHATANTFVGLMAARNVAPFYHPVGFVERPPDRPGMFQMCKIR